MTLKLLFASLLTLILSISLYAEDSTTNEINHLLNYVKTTKCTYIRNGDSYKGPKALSHIQRKYDYFIDDIKSSEDFIRLSATKSTMSGKRYHIKCPNQPEVESAKWLLDELSHYRKTQK
jgi:hypothetical protein